MSLYPIGLKLEAVPCLVVGGGKVALRKIKSLVKCLAAITVVSDRLCRELILLKNKKAFKYKKSKYKKVFLKNNFLVFAATADKQVNARIAKDCFRAGLLVNVADEPRNCNFFVPAVIREDPLLISIATQGQFPGMAKKIRLELSNYIRQCAQEVKRLAKLREKIKNNYAQDGLKKKMIKKILKKSNLPRFKKQ